MNTAAIDWGFAPHPVDYEAAVKLMETRVAAIAAGSAPELIWLVEHAEVYTAGTSAQPGDLIDPDRFPVHRTGRGGQYTYHGPGQRVVYVMLDVRQRFQGDVRKFVCVLEGLVIEALAQFGVVGAVRHGRVGVWVAREELGAGREDKIAAIGIRIRRGISFHGLALNVAPNLSHFDGIVPCGITDHGVTSLQGLGLSVSMGQADAVLKQVFEGEFGTVRNIGALSAAAISAQHATG